MSNFITKFLMKIGERGYKKDLKKSKYAPRYKGSWVNKGATDREADENWVWEDKVVSIRTLYANVVEVGKGSYLITVDHKPKRNSIETVDCEDIRESEIAVALLRAYYGTQGNLVSSTELGETTS